MGNKISIYLVQDDKLFRELAHDYLEQNLRPKFEQVEIRKLSTGERLLNELQEINEAVKVPDEQYILVLDYKLSAVYSDEILNGLDVLKRVKKLKLNTEVIIVSAQDDITVVDHLLEAGAADYIVKNEDTFPRLLNSILRLHKDQNEKSGSQDLYHIVYRSDKKKGGKYKKYKKFTVIASAIAIIELIIMLLFI